MSKTSLLLSVFGVVALTAGCPSADGSTEPGDGGAEGSDPDTGDLPLTGGVSATGVVDSGMTSSATSGATDDSDGGMPMTGFIVEFDGGGMDVFQCDLFAQDCPKGEKCMPFANDGGPAWNATRCSALDPSPAQVGDECMVEGSGVSGVDNCEIGSMCWDVDEQGVGTCEDMCTGSSEAPICENPDDTCSIANGGAIVLCLTQCDPLIQECAEGQACYPINDAFACAPDASGDDNGTHGDPCEFINSCVPGNICIGADAHTGCVGATGCCSSVCSVMDPNSDGDCAGLDGGQSCEAWFVEGVAPPGYEDVGVCALPV